jgi:hypothetical protein
VVSIDGETLQGDIEIHLKTYDWTSHMHHEDPAFNSTILHVVLEHKSNHDFTIREDAARIEILELQKQIDTDIAKLFEKYKSATLINHDGICDYFTLTPNEQIIPLLKQNGWERFQRKCARNNAELHFDGFDQLLYNGFMEAMGYAKNRFNMLSIAQHYKWDTLTNWRKQKLDGNTLAAIWLNYAGLSGKAQGLLSKEHFSDILHELEMQKFNTDKSNIQWNLFRIRPANHPVRRIVQASNAFCLLLDKGFLKSLVSLIEQADCRKPFSLHKDIANLLQSETSESNQNTSIGKTLVMTITANVFLPILYLYAEKIHDNSIMDKVKTLYYGLPAFESNHIISFMHGYLDNVQKKVFNASHICQQGMMNLYYSFCSFRLCESCIHAKANTLNKL